jgi:citrate lyase subunit beta/citryl-CoA lyase
MTHLTALADARSLLFVPGNRPERYDKAVSSGADAIVLDLEDAVPLAEKAQAREHMQVAWPRLMAAGVPVVVRINMLGQRLGEEDLQWLARMPAPAGVMVPKAESAESLRRLRSLLPDVPILPLIESAAGLGALTEIASAGGVLRLVLGHIDFMADTGIRCSEDEVELASLRFAIAMATRGQMLATAVDGVTVAIQDDDLLRRDARRALRFGFGAKLCIHPRQVAVVHQAVAPTAAEVDWARRVVAADAAAGGAAVQIDGRMVDRPVVLQARSTLARADRP